MYYLFAVNLIWSIEDGITTWPSLKMVVLLLNLPGLVIIYIHIFRIARVLGKETTLARETLLKKSILNFFVGAVIFSLSSILIMLICFFGNWTTYGDILVYFPYFFVITVAIYFFLHKNALEQLWSWVTEYARNHPAERVATELVKVHPKPRFLGLAFRILFGEGETRQKAATKFAYITTFHDIAEEKEE